jgi:hypothetical protein
MGTTIQYCIETRQDNTTGNVRTVIHPAFYHSDDWIREHSSDELAISKQHLELDCYTAKDDLDRVRPHWDLDTCTTSVNEIRDEYQQLLQERLDKRGRGTEVAIGDSKNFTASRYWDREERKGSTAVTGVAPELSCQCKNHFTLGTVPKVLKQYNCYPVTESCPSEPKKFQTTLFTNRPSCFSNFPMPAYKLAGINDYLAQNTALVQGSPSTQHPFEVCRKQTDPFSYCRGEDLGSGGENAKRPIFIANPGSWHSVSSLGDNRATVQVGDHRWYPVEIVPFAPASDADRQSSER